MPKVVKISFGDEVRRVPIGVEGKSESYDDLLNAIRVTFPTTDGATLILTWKDEDGDTITMSSEPEFSEAMRSMANGVPKFMLKTKSTPAVNTPKPTPRPASTPPTSNPASMNSNTNKTIHENVECDGCGQLPIVGVRFKSTFRDNYDLCEKCESRLKPTEPMVKLTEKQENNASPGFAPAKLVHETLGQVAQSLDCLLNTKEATRAWQRCNPTTAPVVSAVDQMFSRWTGVRAPQQPAPTSNPTPAPKPALKFMRDVSLPDGTLVAPGATLEKRWLVCNDGKTAWPEGATLYTAGGDALLTVEEVPAGTASSTTADTAASTTTTTSAPGTQPRRCNNEVPAGAPVSPPLAVNEERVLSVRLTAPQQPGRYVAYFRMQTAEGRRFGHRLWADIVVTAPPAASTEVPVSAIQSEQNTLSALREQPAEAVQSGASRPHTASSTASNTTSLSSVSDSLSPTPPAPKLDPLATTASTAASFSTAVEYRRANPEDPWEYEDVDPVQPTSSTPMANTANIANTAEGEFRRANPEDPWEFADEDALHSSAGNIREDSEYTAAPPLYWQQELSLLSEMGFTDLEMLVPLLEKFVQHPAGCVRGGGEGVPGGAPGETGVCGVSGSGGVSNVGGVSSARDMEQEKLRVAQGLQQVLACLLGTRVTEVYI